MKNWKYGLTILALGIVLTTYQNCSETEFSTAGDGSQSTKGNGTLEVGDEVDNEGDTPTTPPEVEEPDSHNNGKNKFSCHLDDLDDVEINIDHIEIGDASIDENTFVGVKSLVAMANGFVIRPEADVSSHQLRIVLKDDSNSIVDTDAVKYALKTPSGQQSGIKLNLGNGATDFLAGQYYRITFEWDETFQLVQAGKKCLLKPVLHNATATLLEF